MPNPLRRLLAPRTPVIERDVTSLVLGDGREVEIQRVRNPRARRLRLSVDERGARLTLPTRASLKSGERFLEDHRDWLADQLERYTLTGLPALQRDITTSLPLRGATVGAALERRPLHVAGTRRTRGRRGVPPARARRRTRDAPRAARFLRGPGARRHRPLDAALPADAAAAAAACRVQGDVLAMGLAGAERRRRAGSGARARASLARSSTCWCTSFATCCAPTIRARSGARWNRVSRTGAKSAIISTPKAGA